MTTPLSPLQQAIIDALKEGDRSLGVLLDQTGANCPELNAALKGLTEQELITARVLEQPPSLIYKLCQTQ